MFIYLDESGDLGFDLKKSKTSAFFVITLLICENNQIAIRIKKAVQRTLINKVSKKEGYPKELKGAKTTPSVKKYFYNQLPQEGWSLYALCVDKKKTALSLKEAYDKRKLYNFFARYLLAKISFPENLSSVRLVVDRSKSKEGIREFNQYIQNHLEAILPLKTPLHISHETSHENPGLQAVDMFCWGIARKHSAKDSEWYKTFSTKIALEESFPKK